MKRLLNIIVISLLLATGASSCRSNKSAVAPSNQSTSTLPLTAPDQKECKQVLASYSNDWQRLKVPMTLRLAKPKSMSVSGNAIFDRGRSITLSMRFLGMEVACLYLTSDSLLAIDKYHKRYVHEALKPILGGFPVNIANVQDLLLGRPFLLGSEAPISTLASKFDIATTTGSTTWTMIPKSTPQGVEYGFSFDDVVRLAGLIVKSGAHQPVTVVYGTPRQTAEAGPVSPSVTVEAMAGKTAVDATIEWELKKARWDKEVELRNITPGKGYERIPASKLLKSVASF